MMLQEFNRVKGKCFRVETRRWLTPLVPRLEPATFTNGLSASLLVHDVYAQRVVVEPAGDHVAIIGSCYYRVGWGSIHSSIN
jgi:hypothetical protein